MNEVRGGYFRKDSEWARAMAGDLHPVLAKALKDLDEGKASGVDYWAIQNGMKSRTGDYFRIEDGWRSAAEQDEAYRQGRTDSRKKITNAKGMESYHQYGLAVDIVSTAWGWEVASLPTHSGTPSVEKVNLYSREGWRRLGIPQFFKSRGISWLGEIADYGHYEYEVPVPVEDRFVVPGWWDNQLAMVSLSGRKKAQLSPLALGFLVVGGVIIAKLGKGKR